METKPNISKRAFWDIDTNSLDYQGDAQSIIVRVLERGTYDDMIEVMKYYGTERLLSELTSAPAVSPRIVNFISAVFNISPQSFKCYLPEQ